MDNIITLTDEEGQEVFFEFLDLIEYEDEEYVVLLPIDDEFEGQVVILRIEIGDENEDKETYLSVDDLDTLNAVFAIFKEKFKEEFNFVDD